MIDSVRAQPTNFQVPLAMLAAGGTAGHLFPAEALSEALLSRGWQVCLVTDRRGDTIGHRIFSGQSQRVKLHRIAGAGVVGKSLVHRIKALALLSLGTAQSLVLLLRLKPRIVIGFGGYISIPPLIAAGQTGTTIILHEQNAVLGRANQLLAPRARAIATSFPITERLRKAKPTQISLTGNPVRPAILALRTRSYRPPNSTGPIRMIITGGSQGARIFADIVPAALANLPAELRQRIKLTQQCRQEDLERVAAIYHSAAIAAELAPFFSDIAERLESAHLALGRAGASTIAELMVAGIPAILVPLPSAADDHQYANAGYIDQIGGGWRIAQSEFTPGNLGRILQEILSEPARLVAAHSALRRAALPDAAERLADLVQTLADPAMAGTA